MDPRRSFAEQVVRQLLDAGYIALWAGGCVRDLLLERSPRDYDVATNARPEQVREVFGQRRTLAVGESFGVICVLGPSKAAGQVEVATFRNDGQYIDGRRPQSIEFSSPEEDAQRRDFTINGMFYHPVDQKVLDYVGGQADLKRRVIRAIGHPQDRMREDKLRMLRGVRFAATFEFEMDQQTAAAIESMSAELAAVSAERITHELRRMLTHWNRATAIRLCRTLKLLPGVLPELHTIAEQESDWEQLENGLQRLGETRFPVSLALILGAVFDAEGAASGSQAVAAVRKAGRRLRLSNEEIRDVSWLVANRHGLDDAPRISLARLKRTLNAPLCADLESFHIPTEPPGI
ncbi:MAG: CCA tRNA nucleotidyltransferase [Planctomycetaceae bacterium]